MEEQSLTNALRPGPECPSIERLGRYADGTLPPGERRQEDLHVATCANCQAELALLRAFAGPVLRDDDAEAVRWGVEQLRHREAEIFDARRPHDSPGRPPRSLLGGLWPLAAVAVVLLAIGGYYLANRASRFPTEIRSSPDVTRALAVAIQGPIGDQTEVPGRLQWHPAAGAARYHVRLTEVDRQEIWSSDTAETAVDLPPEVRARIVPGKTLVWQVTAYSASNAPVAESGAERFRLVR